MADVYQKLREQLDQYSIGFPASESGVELRMLRKLFTEEEADVFLQMTMMLESPESVSGRIGRTETEAAALLDRMAEKGLLFRLKKGDRAKYAATPFVVGLYEFQVGDMDREFAEMFEQYLKEAYGRAMSGGTSLLRPIPVNRSVDVAYPVAPYDVSREILKSQKKIAVANCICRLQQGLLGQECGKPVEVCLVFGSHADYYVSRKMARRIEIDEALKIMDQAEEAGLVSQPFNARNPGGMCNCCGDCCGLLRTLNWQDKPVDHVISNFFAQVDAEACAGCEVCLDRCQMAAITMNDEGIAVVNRDRCIGCGLCVTTCATEAIRLELKPESQRRLPPETGKQQAVEMAEARGVSLTPLYLKQ